MQNDERSRMLGEMPMHQLVPKISVPIMISMIVQALYNVVDSIFVSQYDGYGLTAVSLAFPFQMLMTAFSVGMAVGIASMMSRKLGEGKPVLARRAAWSGLIILACGCFCFMFIGLFLARPLLNLVAADTLEQAERIREMGATYLSIVCIWCGGVFVAILSERMLQATGNSVLSMITQLAGAITNIILDPIMIFTLNMGVAGAAIATVIGQFVSCFLGLYLNHKKNPELAFRISEFGFDRSIAAGIVAVGVPSVIMQAIGTFMNMGMNMLLSGFQDSNAAVNVLNVYFKLQSFVFMPVFGLGSGVVAIVGYNFGARNKKRVREAIKVSLIYSISIMAAGTLIFQLFPASLMGLFESDNNPELSMRMTEIGIVALRTISLMFILAAVGITLSNVFQAVGRGMYSMIISLLRQMVVLLPAAWLLGRITGNVNSVWWSFAIAECFSMAVSLLFYRKLNQEIIDKL